MWCSAQKVGSRQPLVAPRGEAVRRADLNPQGSSAHQVGFWPDPDGDRFAQDRLARHNVGWVNAYAGNFSLHAGSVSV